MTKRVAIIGRGSAGALSMLTAIDSIKDFNRFGVKYEFDWYYDSSIKTQAVGEGTTIAVPIMLKNALNFTHPDLLKIDGTFKEGISKRNWTSKEYLHPFSPPQVAYHINALKLQDYIFEISKKFKHINLHDNNVDSRKIDADLVIDCSGRPENYEDFNISPYISVNSVYVTQCYWDYPKFQYSLTDAMPHGWIFGIPLQNRCSIGYLYNNNYSTLDEVKENVQEVFKRYNLTPSEHTNAFSFKNYYRKTNFVDNIAYNGNASFFLEPLEATTLAQVIMIARDALIGVIDTQIKNQNQYKQFINSRYNYRIESIECMIMLHYLTGSIFNNNFWDYAKNNAKNCLHHYYNRHKELRVLMEFVFKTKPYFSEDNLGEYFSHDNFRKLGTFKKYFDYFSNPDLPTYGTWEIENWALNINKLNLYDDLNAIFKSS